MKYKLLFILFTLLILVNSCCYKGSFSNAGLPRKPIKPFNKSNVGILIIDTLALYKLEVNYSINLRTKKYIFYEKEINRKDPDAAYLKFYPGNKLGYFLLKNPSDTLDLKRYYFDPQNAKMGFYYIDRNDIFIKTSFIAQCELATINTSGTIVGDTIFEEDRNGHGRVYVKQNIPIEYLENWKPDW